MFCPIVNCGGFADKTKNEDGFNICNNGHKFCISCGELWHKNGKCPKIEELDKLFEQFSKRLNLKNCPSCNITTLKREGCNHITCTYCRKEWCWLCGEIFNSTEEHYNNPRKKCFQKMTNGVETITCPKCREASDNFITFEKCGHLICNICFENYIGEQNKLKDKVKCLVDDCNNISYFDNNFYIRFIKNGNNDFLKNKFKKYIFIHELDKYSIKNEIEFRKDNYRDIYLEILIKLYELISDCFYCLNNCPGYEILEIIGIIFAVFFIIVYIIIFPVFFQIIIRKSYYEQKEVFKYYGKYLYIIIFIAEELLSIVYFFLFALAHYIYSIIFWLWILFDSCC